RRTTVANRSRLCSFKNTPPESSQAEDGIPTVKPCRARKIGEHLVGPAPIWNELKNVLTSMSNPPLIRRLIHPLSPLARFLPPRIFGQRRPLYDRHGTLLRFRAYPLLRRENSRSNRRRPRRRSNPCRGERARLGFYAQRIRGI